MRPLALGLIACGFKGGGIPGEVEFFESGGGREFVHRLSIRNFVLIVNLHSADLPHIWHNRSRTTTHSQRETFHGATL